MTYPIGNLTAAYLAMAIPALTALALWASVWLRRDSYRRRFTGWRLAWETWISTALLTAVLFGLFYWYLFWRPFYAISVTPDGRWALVYALPNRQVRGAADQVVRISLQDDPLPFPRLRRSRQQIVVELREGRTFFSAPGDGAEATRLLDELRARLLVIPD